MKHVSLKMGLLVAMAALCVGLIAGCAAPASNVDSAQQENRTYMSKINALMEELGTDLESFVDAVSRNDLVNMRTQADNAFKVLDDLEALEAPDSLSDVRQGYVDGTGKLRDALKSYIDLYTDIESSSFDQSTYERRLSDVQSLYDEGVDLLKKADETAAGK